MASRSENRKINVYINTKLANKSMKDLRTESRKLNNEINQLTPGTEAYRKKLVQLKATNSVLKKHRQEIYNVESGWTKVKKSLGPLAGIMGGVFALGSVISFGKELDEVAQRAKGINLAFEQLGKQGSEALIRVRNSTRGLLSDLDIKQALVEFDNFGISLSETDTLFEFLSVRATQTGESIEKLQSSLVEGLSKESKLRIDNLGISTKDLNSELEKTPNFVSAVANIAKREIAEAGSILDDAANSQSKWNASIENAKEKLAKGFESSGFMKGLRDLGTGLLDTIFNSNKLTDSFIKQKSKVETLEGTIVPLLDRYDKLTSKSEKSKDEQKEVDKIITQIANNIPGAVTEFDKYGKAINVSTDYARKFVTQQKELLKVKNKEAIDEQKESLADLNSEYRLIDKKLKGQAGNYKLVDGELKKLVQTFDKFDRLSGNSGFYSKVSQEEIGRLTTKLAELGSERLGTEALIAELTGTKTEAQKEAEKTALALAEAEKKKAEQEAKFLANKEARDAAYKKLVSNLENLKRATEELQSKQKINNSDDPELEKIKASYQKQIDAAIELEKKKGKIGEEAHTQKLELIKLRDAEIEAYELTKKEKEDAKALELEQKKQDAELKLQQEILTGYDLAVLNLDTHYQNLIALAEEYGIDTTGIVAKYEAEALRIKQESDSEQIKSEEEKNEKLREERVQRLNSQSTQFTELGQAAQEYYDLLGEKGEENIEAQRILTLAKIAFDTASSISSIVAYAAGSSPDPITLAVKIAAGIATVVANMAKAKEAMTVEQKAEGGYDRGSSHNVVGASDGKTYRAKYTGKTKAGMLYEPSLVLAAEAGPEYYVPNPLLSHPVAANHVRAIEAIRTGRQFAEGGFDIPVSNNQNTTVTSPVQQVVQDNTQLANVLSRLDATLSLGIYAKIGNSEIDRIFELRDEIESIRGN